MSRFGEKLSGDVLPGDISMKLAESGFFDMESDDLVVLPEEGYFMIFKDDGKGYAIARDVLLHENFDGPVDHTWCCVTKLRALVWCPNVFAWCEVGEDL